MLYLVTLGAHLWSLDVVDVYHVVQNLDGAPRVLVLNLLFKALMFDAFATLSGRLFQTAGEGLLA